METRPSLPTTDLVKPDLLNHGYVTTGTLHAVGAEGHVELGGAAGVQVVPAPRATRGSFLSSPGGGRWLLPQGVKVDKFPPTCGEGRSRVSRGEEEGFGSWSPPATAAEGLLRILDIPGPWPGQQLRPLLLKGWTPPVPPSMVFFFLIFYN